MLATERRCQASVFKVFAFGAQSDKLILLLPGTSLILSNRQGQAGVQPTIWRLGERIGLFLLTLKGKKAKTNKSLCSRTVKAPQTLSRLLHKCYWANFTPCPSEVAFLFEDGWGTTRPSLHYPVWRIQSQVWILVPKQGRVGFQPLTILITPVTLFFVNDNNVVLYIPHCNCVYILSCTLWYQQ